MSLRLLLAPLCALFLAGEGVSQPPDRAEVTQATCNILDRIFAAADSDYESLRGAQSSPDVHEGTVGIAPFRNCLVVRASAYMYVCTRMTWSVEETERLYRYAIGVAERCLPDWRAAPVGHADAPGLTAIKGMRLAKTTHAGEISFGVLHARDTRAKLPIDTVTILVRLEKTSPVAV